MEESREAAWVRLDSRCGHITINPAKGPALVTMVDTGDRLELWSHQGAHLSPVVATELGAALLTWAEKKVGRVA